jgi:hypothetical protein
LGNESSSESSFVTKLSHSLFFLSIPFPARLVNEWILRNQGFFHFYLEALSEVEVELSSKTLPGLSFG